MVLILCSCLILDLDLVMGYGLDLHLGLGLYIGLEWGMCFLVRCTMQDNSLLNFLELRDRMLSILSEKQEDRPNALNFVYSDFDKREVPQWIINERQLMLAAVNEHRIKNNLLPIDEIELHNQAERRAEGHSDYTSKFSLYCAWLAAGREDLFKRE